MQLRNKTILDATCGGRMIWYQKNCEHALYVDNRVLQEKLSNGQTVRVVPDEIVDFRNMPFADNTFSLVLFDPPHLRKVGPKAWLAKKYGILNDHTWREDIKQGFDECMRVLKPQGVLVFKWSIDKANPSRLCRIGDLLKLIGTQPLFGDRPMSGKTTYWLIFMK